MSEKGFSFLFQFLEPVLLKEKKTLRNLFALSEFGGDVKT